MNHFALSPEANLKNVKWPPRWYYFDPKIFPDVKEALPDVKWLRATNPELRRWTDLELSSAWSQYTQDMAGENHPVLEHQDLFFSAYLYARQELGIFEGKLDELAVYWNSLIR